jgi:uncharacterized membrane protein YgcG
MRVFRKVVMPIAWVAIFGTIAVSLAVMAFGSDAKPADSGLKPTGKIPVTNAGVSRGTVENTLKIKGTIKVDPPVTVKADHDGVINHFFFPSGTKVSVGDYLFQVKSEGDPTTDESGEGKDAAKPTVHYYTVLATKSGKISYSKALGDEVAKGDAVGSIHRETFKATGTISPVDQYRLLHLPRTAKVTITGGPAPFNCGGLAIGDATSADTSSNSGNDNGNIDGGGDPGSDGGESGGGGASITCEVPEDVKVFDGLSMSMSINAGRAENVLVVPVTAVRGLIDKGYVWVVKHGKPVRTRVTLGLTDGTVVEVKKGLKDRDQILEFVPGGSGDSSSGDVPDGVIIRNG